MSKYHTGDVIKTLDPEGTHAPIQILAVMEDEAGTGFYRVECTDGCGLNKTFDQEYVDSTTELVPDAVADMHRVRTTE